MKKKIHQININTKEYFEKFYSQPDWRKDWDGADKRLETAINFITTEYKKHLDVGCADGTFTKLYLNKFPNTQGWGIDISEKVCELASLNCPKGYFQAADAYILPFPDKTFDLVHCAETLEHLEFPEKAIEEAYRVLKLGGDYIVTVPNEKASDYEEHIWKWDTNGVRLMIETALDIKKLQSFEIIKSVESFHNGHVMYIKAKKVL